MGGGRAILTFISTLAIVGIGTPSNNGKSNVPRNNFFILVFSALPWTKIDNFLSGRIGDALSVVSLTPLCKGYHAVIRESGKPA